MKTMMAFQDYGLYALLEAANINIEQKKDQKIYMVNIIFFVKL